MSQRTRGPRGRQVKSKRERPARRDPRSAGREERRAARREEFLEAAIRVVRRDGPAVSMETIAREAGVTKPIIYRAFGDREGLSKAIAERLSGELAGQLASAIGSATTDRERVQGAIDLYLGFIESNTAVIRFLINRSLSDIEETGVAMSSFVRELGGVVTVALGDALRERKLDSGAAEPWAYAIIGAVHLAGDWWLDRKTISRDRLVCYLTDLLFDGLNNVREN